MTADKLYLVLLLPLAGFVINGLLGRRLGRVGVSVVGCGVLLASFAISLAMFFSHGQAEAVQVVHFPWIEVGQLSVPVAFTLDHLSLVMLLVVTGVGSLIHVYSTAYMHDDPSYHRFFAYLNLFVFFMLVLVLGDSLLLMFVGWEGVGLCSYLLIGYDYHRPAAASAGLKAFLVNRVGDVGFLLAMFVAFDTWGSLRVANVIEGAQADAGSGELLAAQVVAALLFFAATGKSAQIPLYVWLPDAMEGPTPVSALIHAATMVTSGVYLATRVGPVFALAPGVLELVMLIGGLTAFLAATMGLLERDMKRVLAYSTISQLGYMFLGVGAGAAASGMFHLTTHAFFKACLFLGAGSVMHALHGQLDLHRMGGLRRKLPITWITMLVATLAIAGFPLLSGFVSKDAILWHAFQAHGLLGRVGFLLAVLTVGLTSFYMFRLYLLAFHGEPREREIYDHAHESPPAMAVVLVLLALLSLGGGMLNWPHALGGHAAFDGYLEPVTSQALPAGQLGTQAGHAEPHAGGHAAGAHPDAEEIRKERIFSISMVAIGLLGFIPAWLWYRRPSAEQLQAAADRSGPVQTLLHRKWYVDDLYQLVFVRGVLAGSRFLWRWIDDVLIDGSVGLVGFGANVVGEVLRMFQTGVLRNYALMLLLGTLAVLIWMVV